MKILMTFGLMMTLSLGSLPLTAQNTIMIRAHESFTDNASVLVISEGSNILESTNLKKFSNAANFEENQKVIHNRLDKFLAEGYHLISSVSGGNQNILITTYVLSK